MYVATPVATVLSTENTEGQTSFSVPVSSQQALEDRDAGNDSGKLLLVIVIVQTLIRFSAAGVQGAQDTNSDSKQKESQEDSGFKHISDLINILNSFFCLH